MSKKRINITFCIILLFVFLTTASAHPGRTDANGGHWNRSTGEYHYHTGEYAGRSQSSSSSQSAKSNNSKATLEAIERLKRDYAQKPTQEKKTTTKKAKNKTTFWDVVGTTLGWLLILGPFIAEIWADIFPSRFTKRMRKIQRERDKQLKQEAIQRRKEEKEIFLKKEEELRKKTEEIREEKHLLKKERRESFMNRFFFWRG